MRPSTLGRATCQLRGTNRQDAQHIPAGRPHEELLLFVGVDLASGMLTIATPMISPTPCRRISRYRRRTGCGIPDSCGITTSSRQLSSLNNLEDAADGFFRSSTGLLTKPVSAHTIRSMQLTRRNQRVHKNRLPDFDRQTVETLRRSEISDKRGQRACR